MRHPLRRARHVRAVGQRQRAVAATKDDVAPHTCRQVQHHIHVCIANAVRDLSVIRQIAARRSGVGIADMTMHNRRARLGRRNRTVCDLCRRTRHMGAAILCAPRPCHGTGDKDLAVHRQWHDKSPHFTPISPKPRKSELYLPAGKRNPMAQTRPFTLPEKLPRRTGTPHARAQVQRDPQTLPLPSPEGKARMGVIGRSRAATAAQ